METAEEVAEQTVEIPEESEDVPGMERQLYHLLQLPQFTQLTPVPAAAPTLPLPGCKNVKFA